MSGKIGWIDLTVDNADEVRDFYQAVANWTPEPVSMGEYNDYNMKSADDTAVAGVCHKRGSNSDQPSQWMMYIVIEDMDAALKSVTELGGEILVPTKLMGGSKYTVIKDPAGAICALYQQ